MRDVWTLSCRLCKPRLVLGVAASVTIAFTVACNPLRSNDSALKVGGLSAKKDTQNALPYVIRYMASNASSPIMQACAGTLLASHIVLTAAHCLFGFADYVEFDSFQTKKIYIHEKYNIKRDDPIPLS